MIRSALLVAATALTVAGCAFSDTITSDDGKSFTVSDCSYRDLWNAGIVTVGSLGSIESKNRGTGEIRGFRSAGAWTNGNALGVFINPPSDNARSFVVSVVGIKASTGQITGSDFTETMEDLMKARLDGTCR